jgi:hypothetical protein
MHGIRWGDLCPDCLGERLARANRLAGRAGLVATVLVALYVWLVVPANPPIGRIYGVIAILATYILVRRIVSRLAMEFLPR